ncbi:hypothetical protein FEM48_Zijuj04G0044300 [Ziziphus jujuba var. spinosa]|uniref:Galectin domain-containing protein n=1 Tax=Ziziphus jujuba var. spinosa TaxID=714518 RepID=A0A978VHT0_ZIZJJ|nr:hypothetical protein FEM48_Zijuj04G0044300 [Ziziphus jujuba var. spinosa]
MNKMKKWTGGVLAGSLFMLLVLRYGVMRNTTTGKSPLPTPIAFDTDGPLQSEEKNTTTLLELIQDGATPPLPNPKPANQVMPTETLLDSSLFLGRNFSYGVQTSLLTWNHMKKLDNYSKSLPYEIEAISEARDAWRKLMKSFGEEKHGGDANNDSILKVKKKKQCPYFISKINATDFGHYTSHGGHRLQIPCGLIQGSAITILGIPNGLLDGFQIDLMGETLPGGRDPPIILHYNVRLYGDKTTDDPVIVQNTWTAAHGWGEEERCPSPAPKSNMKVDELIQCNKLVGNYESQKFVANQTLNVSKSSSMKRDSSSSGQYFPFKQGTLSVMTLRVGEEGFQMTVDGRHITSFAQRESLEPWLVNEVRISEDISLISFVASGLPTSENSEQVVDLEALKSAPLPSRKPLDLFIGIFSTATNFKRRMAVRRTWMQYNVVKTGAVAVRFFVGLHKKQMVNEELWHEVQTYGDIQLMPFVDYYTLITLKTLAICIFGTQVVSARYVMKTDDDAFVRVDEVLATLNRTTVTQGLLYGLINYQARPDRNPFNKWYISSEEWPEETYPPWAHGPGYVVSNDVAKAVYKRHKEGHLKMFKLEDVAMGIWIAELEIAGSNISYKMERRVYHEGCHDDYVVAHYQSPRQILCLWKNLRDKNTARCCKNR